MSIQKSKAQNAEALALEFLGRVWGPEHDLDAIDELMTEDYIIVTGGVVVSGRKEFKNWVKTFQQVLIDAVTINQEVFADEAGERVVSRWVCTGKNKGIFGIEADGRQISYTGIAIWHIRDGKLAECWIERSALELFTELNSKIPLL